MTRHHFVSGLHFSLSVLSSGQSGTEALHTPHCTENRGAEDTGLALALPLGLVCCVHITSQPSVLSTAKYQS